MPHYARRPATPSVTRTTSSRRTSSVAQTRRLGDVLPNTDGSSLSAWTGYLLTTLIQPSPPEHCGSSRAGHIWPPDLVDDDDVRSALGRCIALRASIRGLAL